MTLEELHSAAREGQLQRLSLLSQEGSLYLVEARIDGHTALLCDEGVAKPRHFRSLVDARRALKELAWPSIDLVHLNVADEACAGDPLSPAAAQGAMRLRLPLRP